MKRFLLFLLIVTTSNLFAQTKSVLLSGEISTLSEYKYAFLYDAETKTRYIQPIIEKKFEFIFSKNSDLENKIVSLYFGKDSTRTFADARRRFAFVDSETRQIALEEGTKIFILGSIDDAVVKGGKLNSDLLDMKAAIKSLKYNDFFVSHPDSPISITFLHALFMLRTNEMFIKYSEALDYEKIFSSFSSNIRETERGKKLGALLAANKPNE